MAKNKAVTQTQNAIIKPGEPIPGLEGVEQDMLIIPRLKLVQKNSVEIDDKIASPGDIVNSVTKDIISTDDKPVIIIPIKNSRTRIYFKPFKEGGGILCQSFDGRHGQGNPGGECITCPKNQWEVDPKTGKNSSPDCTELLNIFCMVRGYDFPIPLTASFGRTSMTAGKQLVNFFWADAQKAQKSPWNFAYQLNTEMTENEFGKFYVFKCRPAGMADKKEIDKGRIYYNLVRSSTVQVHEDEDEIRTEQQNIERQKGKSKTKDTSAPEMTEDEEDPFDE